MSGQKERQTLFYRTFSATAGGPRGLLDLNVNLVMLALFLSLKIYMSLTNVELINPRCIVVQIG